MTAHPVRPPACAPRQAPVVPVRGPVVTGLVLLLTLALCLSVWAWVAPVAGVLVVPGRVEGTLARLPLQHADGGRVAAVMAHDGDLVRAGTEVLRLDASAPEAELRQVRSQRDALHLERLRLEAERDGRAALDLPPDLAARVAGDAALAAVASEPAGLLAARDAAAAARRAMMEERSAHIGRELSALSAEDLALAREHALVRQERDAQGALAERGVSPAARVAALERELARIDRARASLAARQAEAEGRMSDIALEALRLDADRREAAHAALGVLLPRLLALEERVTALARQIDRMAVVAPVSGTLVVPATLAPGAVLAPGEAAALLVPAEVPLHVVVQVPARQVGSIWLGQAARIHVPAGRATRPDRAAGPALPWLSGRVTSVSADTTAQGAGGVAAYRVHLALTGTDGRADGHADGPLLRTGLPVDVAFDTGPWIARDWVPWSVPGS